MCARRCGTISRRTRAPEKRRPQSAGQTPPSDGPRAMAKRQPMPEVSRAGPPAARSFTRRQAAPQGWRLRTSPPAPPPPRQTRTEGCGPRDLKMAEQTKIVLEERSMEISQWGIVAIVSSCLACACGITEAPYAMWMARRHKPKRHGGDRSSQSAAAACIYICPAVHCQRC